MTFALYFANRGFFPGELIDDSRKELCRVLDECGYDYILAESDEMRYGEGSGVGVNKGDMLEGEITFGSIRTEGGKVKAFVSDGVFTDDAIEEAFFGSGKVVEKEGLTDIANYMAKNGYKHHICITYSDLRAPIKETFETYLGYDVDVF